MDNKVDYQAFKEHWFSERFDGTESSLLKGRKFAEEIVRQWFDNSDLELIICDGSKDGGIDIAFLIGADAEENQQEGDIWYVVQGKFGTAFAGRETLRAEGLKVIETIEGKTKSLNKEAKKALEHLQAFREQASEDDKIILLFLTEDNLDDSEQHTISNLRLIGQQKLGNIFEIEHISLEKLFNRIGNREINSEQYFELKADLIRTQQNLLSNNLFIGSVSLENLYRFLVNFEKRTGDIDQLYEKNVRRYLGGRGKINKGMKATLLESPENFGLYNNGITIVVNDFVNTKGNYCLKNPYIVNGCQTSRTIWEVLRIKLDSGGSDKKKAGFNQWYQKLQCGYVVLKIIKVEYEEDKVLENIIRYTNSQNVIKEKDFLALNQRCLHWKQEMEHKYHIFLEVQRGEIDEKKTAQKQKPNSKGFAATEFANLTDLIKIYSAGWLKEAGAAYNSAAPFNPDGSIFNKIIQEDKESGGKFGADDLYAAYLLHGAIKNAEFLSRSRSKPDTRKSTHYLFILVVLELLRSIFKQENIDSNHRILSLALAKILNDSETKDILVDTALTVIDDYFNENGNENTINQEKIYLEKYHSRNYFLKWKDLYRNSDDTPILRNHIETAKKALRLQKKYYQAIVELLRGC